MNAPSGQPKNAWQKLRPLILSVSIVACPIAIVALFYLVEDSRGKWAWNNFKHEWEGKGEKFDRASFIPPPVAEDQNFALTPIVFTSYGRVLTRDGKTIPYEKRDTNLIERLNIRPDWESEGSTNGTGNWAKAALCDLKAWQDYYRALAATTNVFPSTRQPQTPAQDVLLALSKYNLTIEEVRQASRLRYSRFPLAYDADSPSEILLPHLAPVKNCSLVLQLRAIAELPEGRSDQALDDLKLTFRLADSVRTEPFLISQLVRIGITSLALQPMYEGLAQHTWSDAQLAELDAELVKLDFLADYKFAMRGEMVLFQEGLFDYLRRHPDRLFSFNDTSEPALPVGKILGPLIPSGWFYQNQVGCARFMAEEYIPIANLNQKTISPSKAEAADATLEADTRHITPYNTIERVLLPALGRSVRRFAYAQSSTDLGRVGIALERFRLAHGSYPDALDKLVPQYLQQVPHDIINGQPLHYRQTDDGLFVLYSVGWNEKDDGGVIVFKENYPSSVDVARGDWVWKYPAK